MSEREIGRKALYNLLRLNWLEDSTMEVLPWQVCDYRQKSIEDLLHDLKMCGVFLSIDSFKEYLEQFDHPESLADALTDDEASVELQDQIYLNVFELWRRYALHKPSLTVFADELDHQVYLYDHEQENEEDIKNVLEYLLEVIEGSPNPEEIFATITSECANDVEAFIYDFLGDQLDKENYLYVSGFLDRIYSSFSYTAPLDFLSVQLLIVSDEEVAKDRLETLIRDMEEHPDYDLGLEVLSYLQQISFSREFFDVAQMLLEQITVAEEMQELLIVFLAYFEQEKDEEAFSLVSIMQKNLDDGSVELGHCTQSLEDLIGARLY